MSEIILLNASLICTNTEKPLLSWYKSCTFSKFSRQSIDYITKPKYYTEFNTIFILVAMAIHRLDKNLVYRKKERNYFELCLRKSQNVILLTSGQSILNDETKNHIRFNTYFLLYFIDVVRVIRDRKERRNCFHFWFY